MNDNLRNLLLTGDNEQIQTLIKNNYMYTNYKNGDLLVDDLDEVMLLD